MLGFYLTQDFLDHIVTWIGQFCDLAVELREVHFPLKQSVKSDQKKRITSVGRYDRCSSDGVVDLVMRAGSDEEGFVEHGTSATLENTVGRWAREGDEAFRDSLTELFREGLAEFGYAETPAERV